MQGLFEKWHQFQTNKKMNKLWNEYKKAVKSGDKSQKSHTLNAFLTQFKEVAVEYFEKQKGHAKLDKLFADITELLTILIDQISSFDTRAPANAHDIKAYFTNVLSSIEVILKDPVYREKLQSSTMLLTQLVLMLDQIADEEAKIILINIVGVLGKNTECRMVIGMHDGFKKLLAVMLEQNDVLMRSIVETFKAILDINSHDFTMPQSGQQQILSSAKQTMNLSKEAEAISAEELKSILQNEPASSTKAGIVLEKNKEEAKTIIPVVKTVSKKLNLEESHKGRPSYEILARISKEMEEREVARKYEPLLGSSRNTVVIPRRDTAPEPSRKSSGDKITCASLFRNFDPDQQKANPFEEVKGNPVVEQMVVQGTLTTVGEIILSAKHDLQVDLMMVICKLIAGNKKNQGEFEKIDGYFLLAVVLSERRDFEDELEKKYLENCLRILKRMIFDDHTEEDAIIKNTEAFKVLLSLISNAQQCMTVYQSLLMLSEILAANVRNCIIFLKLFGFVDMEVLLFRLLFAEKHYASICSSDFCAKHSIKSLKTVVKFKAAKSEKASAGENSIFYETIGISEKEIIDLFTEIDLIIYSLAFILNPLPIMPAAEVYSGVIAWKSLLANDQIFKCIIDRLECMEKDARLRSIGVDAAYSPDLESILANFALALPELKSDTALLTKTLQVYHLHLIHASLLRTHMKAEDAWREMAKMRLPVKSGPILDNFAVTMEKSPDFLSFLNEIAVSLFLHNMVYSELIYSILECIIYSSLPYPQIVKFVQRNLLNKNMEELTWQEIKLLCEVSKSETLMEELIWNGNTVVAAAGSPPKKPPYAEKTYIEKYYEAIMGIVLNPRSQDKTEHKKKVLGLIYGIYLFTYSSLRNLSQFEKLLSVIDFAKKIKELELNTDEQTFLLGMFFNLILRICGQKEMLSQFLYNSCDIYLSLYLKDKKEIDLVNRIREEIRGGFVIQYSYSKSLLTAGSTAESMPSTPPSASPSKPSGMSLPVKFMKLFNLFNLLLLDSSADCQNKILNYVLQYLEISIPMKHYYMHLELADLFLMAYTKVPTEQTQPIRGQYLKILGLIFSYGASFSSLPIFNKLLAIDEDFQQMVNDTLSIPTLPAGLHIAPLKESPDSFLSTSQLKYFPKDKVGFTIMFWVSYNKLTQNLTLFDIINSSLDPSHPPIISYKYSAHIHNTAQPAQANSASFKKEDDSSLGSARASKTEASGKYTISLEVDQPQNVAAKYELDYPVIQEKALTQVVLCHSKFAHSIFINGKLVCGGKLTNGGDIIAAGKSSLKCRIGIPHSGMILSQVTLLEGQVDSKAVANLYARGPSDEKASPLKELKAPFEKLLSVTSEEAKTLQTKGSGVLETSITKLLIANSTQGKSAYIAQMKSHEDSDTPNSGDTLPFSSPTRQIYSLQILPLQECITNKPSLNAIIASLNDCINSTSAIEAKGPQIARLLKLLSLLSLHNEKFTLFAQEMNLIKILTGYINLVPIEIEHGILEFLAIAMCNDQAYINHLEAFTKPPLLSVPVVHSSKIQYFKAISDILFESKQDHREFIMVFLYNLSARQENFEKFAHEKLLLLLIKLLEDTRKQKKQKEAQSCQLDEGYEKLLELFQLYFYYFHCLDWDMWFAYLLMLKSDEGNQDIICDILSLFGVYMLIGTLSTKSVALQESFSGANGIKFLLSLMSYSTVLISEHVIKLLNVLFATYPKSKSLFTKMMGTEIVIKRLQQYEPSFGLLQALFACICSNITVDALYPCNNFFVPTVINRSPIADKIIKSAQGGMQAGSAIANFEMLEVLFMMIARTKELHYRINVLKQLLNLVETGIESESQKVLDSGFFVYLVDYAKQLETEQALAQQQQAYNPGSEKALASLHKIQNMTLKLCSEVLKCELEKNPKQCQIVQILQSIHSVDQLQGMIIERLLKYYCKNSELKKEGKMANTLKNLSTVIPFLSQNLESVITSLHIVPLRSPIHSPYHIRSHVQSPQSHQHPRLSKPHGSPRCHES